MDLILRVDRKRPEEQFNDTQRNIEWSSYPKKDIIGFASILQSDHRNHPKTKSLRFELPREGGGSHSRSGCSKSSHAVSSTFQTSERHASPDQQLMPRSNESLGPSRCRFLWPRRLGASGFRLSIKVRTGKSMALR